MIANIQDINTDLFYTLWLFMPASNYHVLERTYPGQYIKDILWSEVQEHNRNNTRQYKFFPQHKNPNENEMNTELNLAKTAFKKGIGEHDYHDAKNSLIPFFLKQKKRHEPDHISHKKADMALEIIFEKWPRLRRMK